MNYISQIRAFYDTLLVRPLSAGQIALWHGLMDRCNRLGWPEWFTAANISLESSCSLSRKGIYDSRNSLKQAGLIDFRSNGTKAASYKIIVLYSTQDTTQVSTQATTQDTTQVTATLLKPKQKQKHSLPPISPGFDLFWEAYPNKKAKDTARKSWAKICPDETLTEKIVDAVKAQKESKQWKRDGGQYIPHPSTWLNQRRWEDESPGNSESAEIWGGFRV